MRAGVTADEVAALALAMSRKKGIMRTFSGAPRGASTAIPVTRPPLVSCSGTCAP
jgi:hypothetical protein